MANRVKKPKNALAGRVVTASQGIYDVGAKQMWKRKKALEERNAIRHELLKHQHRQQLAGELDRLQGYNRRLDARGQERLADLHRYLGPGHAGSAAPPPLHPML